MLAKRLTALVLAAVLCLGLASCSMEREYIVIKDHSETYTANSDSDVFTVRNYNGLKNAIWYMVSERMDYMVLRLYNFGEDVNNQIYEACMEVQRSTPIGAYAVDYFVTPGCEYIVSYYEAEISVNYRVSEEQMDRLSRVSSIWTARDEFEACLEARDEYAAFWVNSLTMDENYMYDIFTRYYYANPFFAATEPKLSVNVYSDSSDRIVETSISYAHKDEDYTQLLEFCTNALSSIIVAAGSPEQSLDYAYKLCAQLAEASSYDAVGARALTADSPLDERFNIYGTLHGKNAVGEGYAVTFDLLCSLVGIECELILGTMSGVRHAWNRLTIDGRSYYVDCAMFDHLAREAGFGMSDEYMVSQGYIQTAVY